MNKKRILFILTIIISIIICSDVILSIKNKDLLNILDRPITNHTEQERKITIKEKTTSPFIIYLEEPYQLTLLNEKGNSNISGWNYNWITSNVMIAAVSKTGLVVGKTEGTAVIRVTNKNDINIYDIITIKVLSRKNKLEFKETENNTKNLMLGEVRKLDLNTLGNITNNKILWESSNNNILEIKDGYVFAKSLGTASITATSAYNENYTDEIKLTVKDNSSILEVPTTIKINHLYLNNKEIKIDEITTKSVNINDKLTINASTNTNLKTVTFQTLSKNINTLSTDEYVGTFEFTSAGIAIIEIQSAYNENTKKILKIVVTDETKIIHSFKNETSKTINLNNYTELIIKDNDKQINSEDLIVEIINQNILKYETGFFCPISIGKTNVTVTYLYDKTFTLTFEIEIKEETTNTSIKHINIKDVTKNNEPYNINTFEINEVQINDQIKFSLEVLPLNTTFFNNIKVFTTDENAEVEITKSNFEYIVTITFKKQGITDIYIKTYEDNINIEKIQFNTEIEKLDFDFEIPRLTKIIMGNTYNLNIQKIGEEPKNIKYTYISSNNDIITIGNNGNLIALNEGTSTITITATFDRTTISKELTITVIKEYKKYDVSTEMTITTYKKLNNELVKIDFTTDFLNVYQKAYLNIKTNSSNSLNKNYEVISSNSEILFVSYIDYQYELYAIKPGNVTITIKNYENESLTTSFNVYVYDMLPKYFIPVLEKSTINIKEKVELSFLIDPKATIIPKNIQFSIPNILKIEDNTIIPLNEGTTDLILNVTNETGTYNLRIPITIIDTTNIRLITYENKILIIFTIIHVILYLSLSFIITKLTSLTKKSKYLYLIIISLILFESLRLIKPDLMDIISLLIIMTISLISSLLGILLAKMKTKKLTSWILILLTIITLSSCKKNNQTANNQQYTINQELKDETISKISKTNKSKTITYQIITEEKTIYISYFFEKNQTIKKEIYSFYNKIENFQSAILNYNNILDGQMVLVNEEILLIKTEYENIDKESYEQIYKTIEEKYQIIKE